MLVKSDAEGKKKEKGPYPEKLKRNAKQRYQDELNTLNSRDPCDLAAHDWIADPDALPPLIHLNTGNNLVFGLMSSLESWLVARSANSPASKQ